MDAYKYQLENGSKKHLCPGCSKKRFVRYINTEDGNYLPEQYGRCDRESKCGYCLNPYNDGYTISDRKDNFELREKRYARAREAKPVAKPAPVFIPDEVFSETLKNYEQNTFIQNLFNRVNFPFEAGDIENVISLYYLGTVANGYRTGAVTFPFIDFNGKIRAIQVKQFDGSNHTTGTDFLHSIIEKHYIRINKPVPNWLSEYIKQDKRITCLFGEHLLSKYPYNPIALVEAPKTAVYGSLYFGFPNTPDNFIWLAVYNKSSFNYEKIKALKGREVYVFPDLSKDGGTFNEWKLKADAIEKQLPGTRFIFSNLLEQLAPDSERNNGNDLADFLIQLDWRNFRKNDPVQNSPEIEPSEKSEESEPLKNTFILPFTNIENNVIDDFDEVLIPIPNPNWDNAIAELEVFFDTMILAKKHISFTTGCTITNLGLFIKSHLSIVKAQNGKQVYLPYLERLQELKTFLTN